MFPSKFLCSLAATVATMCFMLSCNFPITTATTTMMTSNQSEALNTTSNIQVRSPPPAKSLFNSQLFQSDNLLGGVMKTFVNSLPLRESYIAFEQAHQGDSSSQEFDQFFKPSRFPVVGYDQPASTSYYTKLQNSYSYPQQPPQPLPPSTYFQQQQSPYYMPFPPPQLPPAPPPPPPQQFLRLVKIPGDLKIERFVTGGGRNDLQVICEFPPYILIVQQIYWHVIPPPSSLLLPYGTFYDSRNGFAPRITVTSISKWKSVLTVRDYTPDDYGTYRCVTTAILPDEPEPTYSVQLPHLPPTPPTYFVNYPRHESLELRSAASTVSLRQLGNEGSKENDDNMASASQKRERKIKFVRRKREIGVFGVHAPFFKPHYDIYRVFKEVKFPEEIFGLGSDAVENTLGSPESLDKVTASTNAGGNKAKGNSRGSREDKLENKSGGRRFDLFTRQRQSKVLF